MLDWNGNGHIDPVDIGISITTQQVQEKAEGAVQTPDKLPFACLRCSHSSLSLKKLIAVVFHKYL